MEHKGTKTIETERLVLRPFKADDAEPMYRNWASDPEVTKYLTWPTHRSTEESKQVIADWTEQLKDPAFYQWAIELKEIEEPIGSISVIWIREDIAACEVGYCLSERFWGKGIMPEALAEVIRFLFEEVGMNRIQATHDARNPNSGRVMEKCGMLYEGTMRQASRNNQGIDDSVVRAILKEDYIKG